MKLCVFGAGAIGGQVAARLARAGADVSVVARGVHLDALRRNGLRVAAPDGNMEARLRASDDAAALGPQDAVIVTVKAPSMASVATRIGPLLGPDTPVVFVINGIPWWYFHAHGGPLDGHRLPRVDPDDAVWNAVGPARAIGGVVYSASTVTEPGVVHVESARNRIILGLPDGRPSACAEAIAALLREGGVSANVTERIRDAVWDKLLLNLGVGPMCLLSMSGQRAVGTEPACADAMRTLMEEGTAIARALGCTVKVKPETVIAGAATLSHKPSIVQDLERGRPLEIDALYDAPLELAQLVGVETPMLRLMTALMKLRARAAGLYGA